MNQAFKREASRIRKEVLNEKSLQNDVSSDFALKQRKKKLFKLQKDLVQLEKTATSQDERVEIKKLETLFEDGLCNFVEDTI